MAVGVVVEGVELVVHDADEPSDRVWIYGQCLAAVLSIAHFLHQLEDLEAEFGDFDGVVGELSFRDSGDVDQ